MSADTELVPTIGVAPPTMGEVASTRDGRDITRGYVDGLALLEPTDSVLRIRNAADYRVFEEILRDDQVKAVFDQRRLAVVSREWAVEPGGDRPIDIAAADDLRATLKRIQFDRVTDRMLYGTFYGFSVGECLYSAADHKVRLDAIKVRRQRRFGWAPDGTLRLLTTARPQGEAVPDRKFWTFESGGESDDDPYGLGLAHWLYWPTFFKRHGLKYWMIFLEKFGQPTALGEFPTNATDEEKKKLLAALQAITTDSGIAVPQGMLIRLLEAARSGTADYATLCDRMDAAISKVVLGQTMTTDPGASLSQAEVHMDVRQATVKADADTLCASFVAGPATWLTNWNFPGAAVPEVWRRFDDRGGMRHQAETEKVIAEATGMRPTKKYVEETYGGEWEDRPQSLAPMMQGPSFAERRGDPVDQLTGELTRAAGQVVTPWIDRLRELAEEAESLEEFRDRLLDVYADLDATELGTILEAGLTLADLRGRDEVGRA